MKGRASSPILRIGLIALIGLAAIVLVVMIALKLRESRGGEVINSNWITYTGGDQYSIAYPPDQYINVKGPDNPRAAPPGVIILQPVESADTRLVTYSITICLSVNSHNYTLAKNSKELLARSVLINYDPQALRVRSPGEYSLGGEKGLLMQNLPEGPNGLTMQIAVIHNGFIFEVNVTPFEPQGDPEPNKSVVAEILQSFQFLK